MAMTPPDQQFSSHFAEISRARCEELLARHRVGRVAWNSAVGPYIFPVNYSMYAGNIVFRTSPYGALATLMRRTPVAFEIDEIDEDASTGWNVLVLGSAQAVTADYPLTQLWKDGPVPWASGTRNVFISITPREYSGRAVRGPFTD